jgi:hypothetical protein
MSASTTLSGAMATGPNQRPINHNILER